MAKGDPDLQRFLGKRLRIKLNGNRIVTGELQGFDNFLNLSLGSANEILSKYVDGIENITEKGIGTIVIRGNAVIEMECLEQIFG